VVNRVNDLACVDSLEINQRDAEVRVPELPLDNRQRDPFVRHLDRVRMTQLVRHEPTPQSTVGLESAKLAERGGRGPALTRFSDPDRTR
jgi:hypothetical protein